MQSRNLLGLAASVLASLLPAALPAQPPAAPAPPAPTTMFPFVIPWDDATPGTATDMSFLSPKAAGEDGYIVARDGHFVTSKNGKRIRFLGTNFTFASDFPTHTDAEKVAAHLRKMGINIVRIHHHDFNSGQLWDKKYPDHRHIDAGARDRLDYLIYQLKRNGVYVDLNLHVSRQFTADDGFPASVDQLKDYDKRVDYFEPKMIELQKEFARDYLLHVNPYTKMSYCQDPCVALIEINNENSLVSDAGSRLAGELIDLPEPFRGELVGQWNDWLAAKYHNDAGLAAAWSAGSSPLGENMLLAAGTKWSLEHQGESMAVLEPQGGNGLPPGATINVQKIDATGWHVQAHFTGLDFKEGETYTVRFAARVPDGAPTRSMAVNTGLDQPDWHHIGLDTNVQVGPRWKTYQAFFAAQNVVANHGRLSFGLGNQAGTVEIRDVSVQQGVPPATGRAETSLAKRNIDLPESATRPERADWIAFLEDTERKYADGMRGFLKNDLKAHASICCSQIMWGDTAGFYREANMDFADGHAYWEHPSFPHKAWDMNDWTIGNHPMVADLASGGGGTLRRLAEYRVAGKPYTVTEYNEPAPNDYQCETVPELAAFAAAQDWDAIFLFDYGDYGANAANDRIQSFFGIGSNPAKMAFMPAAALMFRAGQIHPSPNFQIQHVTTERERSALPVELAWNEFANRINGADPLRFGRLSVSDSLPSLSHESDALPNPNHTMSFRFDPTNKWFHVYDGSRTTGSAIDVGYLGGHDSNVMGPSVHVAAFGNNFCAVTVTLLPKRDDGTVDPSPTYLITLVGKVENSGMGWNAAYDSVGSKWGSAPSQAEFIPAAITVHAGPTAHVWALDPTGKRTAEISAKHGADGTVSFNTSADAHTVWYEVGQP